jgi:hypothetical protein
MAEAIEQCKLVQEILLSGQAGEADFLIDIL